MKFKMKIIVSFLFYMMFGLLLNAQDYCKDILVGVMNTKIERNKDLYEKYLVNYACKNTYEEVRSKFGVNVVIPNLNLPVGFSNDDFKQRQALYCGFTSEYNYSEYESYLSYQFADKDVVEKWSKCMSERRKLTCWIERLTDKKYNFRTYWDVPKPLKPVSIPVTRIEVNGEPIILDSDKKQLNIGPYSHVVERPTNDSVKVELVTTNDPITESCIATIPPKFEATILQNGNGTDSLSEPFISGTRYVKFPVTVLYPKSRLVLFVHYLGRANWMHQNQSDYVRGVKLSIDIDDGSDGFKDCGGGISSDMHPPGRGWSTPKTSNLCVKELEQGKTYIAKINFTGVNLTAQIGYNFHWAVIRVPENQKSKIKEHELLLRKTLL